MIGWFLVKLFFCNPALVGPSLFLVVLFGTLHTCCVPRCAISLAEVYNITSLLIKKKCRQKSSIVCNMLLAMAKYVCFCFIDYALNLALDYQEKGKQEICLTEPQKVSEIAAILLKKSCLLCFTSLFLSTFSFPLILKFY